MSNASIEIGQKFYDEANATEVEVMKFNGSAYHCKTTEGACDDDPGTEGYQWFTRSELAKMKPTR